MQPLLKQVGKSGKTSVVIAAICTACVSTSAANATTVSFVLKDSNKAINVWLNSNASYRFDGYPRAFVLDYNPNDREQRFNELPGNQGGKLYQVEGTNLCLNNAYNYNGAPINVWPCNPNDRDQNWRQINLAGSIHLQNFTTGRCADSPFRNLDPKNLHAWDCMPGNRNQQFNVVVRGGNTPPTGLHSNPTLSNPLQGFKRPVNGGGENAMGTHWDGFGQKYAVDFGVGFGTPVYAMRSGTVISWNDATPDRDTQLPWIDDGRDGTTANYLVVKLDDGDGKDDGYRAMYLHLRQNSIPGKFKRVGARVEVGEKIGEVGYNGLARGVHLHAEVNRQTGNTIWQRNTVPFRY